MKGLFTTNQLAVIVAALTFSALSVYGIAMAQSAEEGIANYYSDRFQGRKTASGAVYDRNKLTAAHKTFPFGTKVRVTNLANGKSVVVTINDRMRRKNPVVIDVTRRAAQELGFVKAGKTRVKLEVEK
jgi:rare lipoprotein A